MIIGIGTDIVDISRMERIVNRYTTAFLEKIFTEGELNQAANRNNSPEFFSGRWAVKEAVSKALGCGIGENCGWHDIATSNSENGKPEVKLTGNAAKFADQLGVKNIHVSISHDRQIACAFVVLEAETNIGK